MISTKYCCIFMLASFTSRVLARQFGGCISHKMDISLQNFKNISWCKQNWNFINTNNEMKELLKQCTNLPNEETIVNLTALITRSNSFPIPFPINTVRLSELKKRKPLEKLRKNIGSTYPIIHERVLLQMANFLTYKRKYGSFIEKELYKNMTMPLFVDRLLLKRAITFMNPEDYYILLNGEEGSDGWESVGTPEQTPPLVLENCLSYDEMKLSAMLYVSGYTCCINDGRRNNSGVVEESGVEEEAIIIGLIGPRFEREFKMDYEDILITKKQNTVDNGYGRSTQDSISKYRQMWAEFYDTPYLTYEELPAIKTEEEIQKYQNKYVKINDDTVFDNEIYYKRITILADTTLLEAESRAVESGKKSYVNVIGCGLGVWRVSSHQSDVYVLTFVQRVQDLLQKGLLNHVSDVNFAYIRVSDSIRAIFDSSFKKFIKYEGHSKGGINIQVLDREPSSLLSGEHAGKLLVMTYPWDGNAHPGNEFWTGSLSGSGDPAAACSTQVCELHNAHINTALRGRAVRVAGGRGVAPLDYYCLAHTAS